MAELNANHAARQHLYILQRHVLGPLSTAETVADRERSEVAAERDAFDEFGDRVADLPAVTADRQTVPLGAPSPESHDRRAADLREAYEDTVMAVSHYEDAYSETLEENATVELGAELAQLFRVDSSASFSPYNRDLLVSAANRQVEDREKFCAVLDTEIESVQSTSAALSALLDTLDNSIVPDWHSKEFRAELDTIQASRQTTLFSRSLPSGYDGHTLCGYLYDEEPWTYPGLTAVARLLDSVVLQDE